ncbi:DMT family transporter [Clostridium sp. JN-9]|uniref:DMT family transporter n=1 Tax=Clostridium sp. JN-9 TaxID=2507159 RepID=UPI000FFDFC01|nr:DMT family transporter [Clostridium sp. JN-9]QAT41235.1 DMT family transporter [Clostridium sp. JN-9]
MLYIVISILAGVSVVVSRIINSNLAKEIGIFQSTFYNYIVGLFFSVIFFILSREKINLSDIKSGDVPFWAYLGGVAGVLLIVLSNYITPRISSFYLTLLIFVGQLFTGIIIDYFVKGNISSGKLIGGLLVLAGLIYNLVIDKKSRQNSGATW